MKRDLDHPAGVRLWHFLHSDPQRSKLERVVQDAGHKRGPKGALNDSGLSQVLRKAMVGRGPWPDRDRLGEMKRGERAFDPVTAQVLLELAGCDRGTVDHWIRDLTDVQAESAPRTSIDSEPALTTTDLQEQFTELAIDPLTRVVDEPWLWLEDMTYHVDIRPDGHGVGGRTKVDVSNASRRILGGSAAAGGGYWVSFARTEEAYQREFGSSAIGCLAREIVPLPGLAEAAWQEAVGAECSAHLTVDGSPVELIPEATADEPDVVRWRTTPEFVPPAERVLVDIEFHYPLDPRRQAFTVTFLSYYCLGNTRIRLTLHAPREDYELSTHVFYGRSLETPAPDPLYRGQDDRQVSTFTTGQRSLLWPGSGVYFGWQSRAR